ncbi:MAG: acyl carrier protein [Oscillospiraceae bacterium]|nr:acyl carrier protein [Oscillospiraceae bacterium]MBQ9905946.1 acyl carrier protein [Oscillospiraceae bacterium]MCR4760267.1 acyl carrier protein [Oscillospiraceae bacterium]
MNEIRGTIIEILQDLHEDVDFENETRLIDDKILDSFDIVTLISELSNEFDVTIPADKIIPENFNSADALTKMITELEDE